MFDGKPKYFSVFPDALNSLIKNNNKLMLQHCTSLRFTLTEEPLIQPPEGARNILVFSCKKISE